MSSAEYGSDGQDIDRLLEGQIADEIRTLAEVERDYIAAARLGGNRAKAAEKLGIGAATLCRKLKQERQ